MNELVFFICFISVIGFAVTQSYWKKRKYAKRFIVHAGVEYPNNFHVLGVGYYHAADGCWYRVPWNEYREERGYFWQGEWRSGPDRRMVERSVPRATEVERVNAEWRAADPDDMARFWSRVETGGFGAALRPGGS